MTDETKTLHGACLCGAVAFEVTGPVPPVTLCHCGQCRRWTGHVNASSGAPLSRFRLTREEGLAWHASSPGAQRGFCRRCGSSLFWRPEGEARIAFSAGALEAPTGLSVGKQIFREDAGDYYAPSGPPPEAAAVPPPGRLRGACLCGESRFTLPAPAGPVTACHCTQCRKTSGHFAASFDVAEAEVDWQARQAVREFATPGGGTRGFCGTCGSSLWFRAANGAFSVEAGSLAAPTGGHLAAHIFTAFKGDYYEIEDGLPQSPEG